MGNRALILILLITLSISCNKRGDDQPFVVTDEGVHPRLLLLEGEETQIQNLIDQDETWKTIHVAILKRSNDFFKQPLLSRTLTGRRLLSVSRECIRRVFFLAYAYRMSGVERFARRAEQEMLAVAGFSDWNPSHFLDVAEMTMGMAIGYDWLYDQLSEPSRRAIRNAIKLKGLQPSLDSKNNAFLRATHNWNQVCNAGLTFGALATAGAFPELAEQIIERAISTINLPMEKYGPDGAYPEGYGYWGYGTSMNVMFLSALEKALETDYGLSATPGFLPTAEFLQHMLAPSFEPFNWGDCAPVSRLQPAMFWFAQKNNDPSLLWLEQHFLEPGATPAVTNDRLLPALFIWAKDMPLNTIRPPDRKFWVGQGPNPVAMMRTSWTDPNAIYLGFKAGSPSVNHGHMDIGSFVMEADGIRWASDFGLQNYESLESKGIQVFGRTQDAQRWTIFRYNNLAHNTLTIDHEHQQVNGYARIDRYSDAASFSFAISDLSSVYSGQLQKALRGVGMVNEQYVLIQDEIRTLDKATTVRWTMLTTADVSLEEKGAVLTKEGKTLYLQVQGPDHLQMKTWSTDPGTDYDAPNPGTILIGFECEVAADREETFQVRLIPEKSREQIESLTLPLDSW